MSDLFLGIIAGAVLVMAIIQVAAIVFAAKTARRVTDAVARLEQGVQPIVASLQQVSADAARATAAAATQVERTGKILEDLATRLDSTIASLQDTIVGPARDGFAFLQSLKSIFDVFRATSGPRRKRSTGTEEEDALFIG